MFTTNQILVIVGASTLGALVKGVTGLGYSLLAVPLMSLVIGVQDAVVIVALPNLVANIYLCWEARTSRDETRDLLRLVGFGVVGAVVGTVALVNLPEDPLLVALALTIAVFVIQFLRHPHLTIPPEMSRRWSPAAGTLAGMFQGAIGVSGPVVATWMHGYRLSKQAYVFSITLVFGVTGAVQLATLAAQGEVTGHLLSGSAVAAGAVLVMTLVGVRLRARLAGPRFSQLVVILLSFTALSLMVQVVT